MKKYLSSEQRAREGRGLFHDLVSGGFVFRRNKEKTISGATKGSAASQLSGRGPNKPPWRQLLLPGPIRAFFIAETYQSMILQLCKKKREKRNKKKRTTEKERTQHG